MVGADLHFKCENFQKIGAFKIRGAINAALNIDANPLKFGIVTHSSGNHAQAIAYTAEVLNTKAYIMMPNNSPKVKINAVLDYVAELFFCEPNQTARENMVLDLVERTGAYFIHPYDNDEVITGQATCAKELIEDAGPFDAIITPVGGGGLLSGTCLSTRFLLPKVKVYAGEPEGAADAILSLKSCIVEQAPFINTIADGLLTKLSTRTLGIIKTKTDSIYLVSEAEIKSALRLVYERMKIVIEPSCALPSAAVLKNKSVFTNKKVGIILTGGNIDLSRCAEYFN